MFGGKTIVATSSLYEDEASVASTIKSKIVMSVMVLGCSGKGIYLARVPIIGLHIDAMQIMEKGFMQLEYEKLGNPSSSVAQHVRDT